MWCLMSPYSPFSAMSTSPSDPTTLDFLNEDDISTMPIGPSAVVAGNPPSALGAPQSPVPGATASAPGASSPVLGAHSPVPSPPLAIELGSGLGGTAAVAPNASPTIEPGSGSGAATTPSASGFATPADVQSQAAASRASRTTATRPQSIVPVVNDHNMQTRGKFGFVYLVDRLNLHTVTLSPLPKTFRSTLAHPNW
jgi:hypothetical protein